MPQTGYAMKTKKKKTKAKKENIIVDAETLKIIKTIKSKLKSGDIKQIARQTGEIPTAVSYMLNGYRNPKEVVINKALEIIEAEKIRRKSLLERVEAA